MTASKRLLAAKDLLTLQTVGDPQISPDGTQVAFARTTTDTEKKHLSQ